MNEKLARLYLRLHCALVTGHWAYTLKSNGTIRMPEGEVQRWETWFCRCKDRVWYFEPKLLAQHGGGIQMRADHATRGGGITDTVASHEGHQQGR